MTRGLASRLCKAVMLVSVALFASTLPATGLYAKETVKIAAAVSWPAYAFWEIIKTQNLAPDLDLEVTILNDPIGGYAMLSSDQFQVLNNTIDYTPIAAEQGLPIRQVTLATISNGVDQVMIAPNTTPDQLKGKRVAAPDAFVGQLLVGYWLMQHGIGIHDVTWVNLNADEATGGLIGGDISLAYMYEPWTSKILQSLPGAKIIAQSNQPDIQHLGMIGDAIYMNEKFITEHRDTAVKLMRAYWDAVQWWKDHPTKANKIISDSLQWPVADTESVWGKDGTGLDVQALYPYKFSEAAAACNVSNGAMPFGLVKGQIFKAYENAGTYWKALGLVKTVLPADKGIDCSIMADLVKSGYTGQP